MIHTLSLDALDKIMNSALTYATQNNWPVSVAICDAAGFLLAFKRLPNAPLFSVKLAVDKARTAAVSKRDTKAFEEMVNGGKLSLLSAGEIVCIEGGVFIMREGHMLGGIGVSGVKSYEDGSIARHALGDFMTE